MSHASGRASLRDRREAPGRPFLELPRLAAALLLALLTAALGWSVLAAAPTVSSGPARVTAGASPAVTDRVRGDMALYARIHSRMTAGEGYYAAAVSEQRASRYPTRPFVAVRLPTLAWVQTAIGTGGVRLAAFALALASLWAMNARANPLASRPELVAASMLLALGSGAAFSPVAVFDHDFIAGLLLTLALLAYRRACWWPALLAAGAALAVRELAAPFVLLWLAFALIGQRWREAGGIAALLAMCAGGMALHAAAVDAARLPGDLASQGWSGLAGFGLPITALGQLTGLRLLPASIAAPLAILPMIGWAAIGGRTGLFAALYFIGIAAMMALFARPENYYWVQIALPAYALGLAFAPRGIGDLVQRASRQT